MAYTQEQWLVTGQDEQWQYISVPQHQVLNPFLGGHNSSCGKSGNSIYTPEFEKRIVPHIFLLYSPNIKYEVDNSMHSNECPLRVGLISTSWMHQIFNHSCIYKARISPTLNRSSVIWRFKHSNTNEMCNGITFDIYMGLQHVQQLQSCQMCFLSHEIVGGAQEGSA